LKEKLIYREAWMAVRSRGILNGEVGAVIRIGVCVVIQATNEQFVDNVFSGDIGDASGL
jgi:hypothetical protein